MGQVHLEIALMCTGLAMLIGLIAFSGVKKKEHADSHANNDPHGTQPHGGGGHGGGHDDHPKAKTFMHMFGIVILVLLAVIGGYYVVTDAIKKNNERESAKKLAEENKQFPTHTSSSVIDPRADTNTWITITLNEDKIVLLEHSEDTRVIWKTTGDKVDAYFGNDTTDLINKMYTYSLGDHVSTKESRFLAFKKVENYPNKLMYRYEIGKTGQFMPNPIYIKVK